MKVISVKFKENGRSYYFDPADLQIRRGDFVIVETARGTECGEVVRGVHEVSATGFNKELKPVVRMADGVDIRRMRQNRDDERRAFQVCEQRIAAHGLDMKLVEAEYTLDRSKLIFYFTADNRVDFRELVKDLAGHFHTRIELRQIGVRDESKMLGGLGICGQPFCCSRFLKNFQPVSIKMAKEQGLSLNPAKISGACGRLMCCLAYEQKSYEYLNSITPPVGSTVRTPDGEGVVTEVNVIAGTLKVRSSVESLPPRIYKREDCVYLRGGRRAPRPPADQHAGPPPPPAALRTSRTDPPPRPDFFGDLGLQTAWFNGTMILSSKVRAILLRLYCLPPAGWPCSAAGGKFNQHGDKEFHYGSYGYRRVCCLRRLC